MILIKLFLFLFLLLPMFAQDKETNISTSNEVIRLVPPTAQNSAGFLKLTNSSATDIKLLKAESTISTTVELHDVVMESGKMTMRPITEITIPAKGSVELKPGSLHIMFIGLKSPLKAGDSSEIKLTFDSKKSITFKAFVKEIPGMMKKMAE